MEGGAILEGGMGGFGAATESIASLTLNCGRKPMFRAMRDHNQSAADDGGWGMAMVIVMLALAIVVIGALI